MKNHFHIDQETIDNVSYRKVIFTGENLQLVLMSLAPKESIGREIHENTDQFFRIEKGNALFTLEDRKHYKVTNGDAMVVPAGTWHDVKNLSSRIALKLYTIYAPPQHPPGTVQRYKHD